MENPCSGDDDRVHNRLGSMALVDLQSHISWFGQPTSTQSRPNTKLSYVILYKGGKEKKNLSICCITSVLQMKNSLIFIDFT